MTGTRILSGRATTEDDATFDVVATLLADLSALPGLLAAGCAEPCVIHSSPRA